MPSYKNISGCNVLTNGGCICCGKPQVQWKYIVYRHPNSGNQTLNPIIDEPPIYLPCTYCPLPDPNGYQGYQEGTGCGEYAGGSGGCPFLPSPYGEGNDWGPQTLAEYMVAISNPVILSGFISGYNPKDYYMFYQGNTSPNYEFRIINKESGTLHNFYPLYYESGTSGALIAQYLNSNSPDLGFVKNEYYGWTINNSFYPFYTGFPGSDYETCYPYLPPFEAVIWLYKSHYICYNTGYPEGDFYSGCYPVARNTPSAAINSLYGKSVSCICGENRPLQLLWIDTAQSGNIDCSNVCSFSPTLTYSCTWITGACGSFSQAIGEQRLIYKQEVPYNSGTWTHEIDYGGENLKLIGYLDWEKRVNNNKTCIESGATLYGLNALDECGSPITSYTPTVGVCGQDGIQMGHTQGTEFLLLQPSGITKLNTVYSGSVSGFSVSPFLFNTRASELFNDVNLQYHTNTRSYMQEWQTVSTGMCDEQPICNYEYTEAPSLLDFSGTGVLSSGEAYHKDLRILNANDPPSMTATYTLFYRNDSLITDIAPTASGETACVQYGPPGPPGVCYMPFGHKSALALISASDSVAEITDDHIIFNMTGIFNFFNYVIKDWGCGTYAGIPFDVCAYVGGSISGFNTSCGSSCSSSYVLGFVFDNCNYTTLSPDQPVSYQLRVDF